MAGAGYKLFNTGDVLTAAQVNTYLQEQTVMVFANAAARTSALSGVLAEGMISYLKDTNAVEKYDGSAWSAIGTGDIEGVTAGTGLTGGGSSGTVTLNFDVANYGGGSYAAGKNAIINGDFRINQRGLTSTTNAGYGFDRWSTNNVGGTYTYSAETFTAGTAPVAGYEGTNFARVATTGQSTQSQYAYIEQKIEDVRTDAGQTVTLSFWAKAGSGTPFLWLEYGQFFGTGGSASVEGQIGSTITLSTSWTRYTATVAIPSIAGKTIGTSSALIILFWTSVGSSIRSYPSATFQNASIDIWGVQLEAGSTATAFQTATGTLQGELAACQRYYNKTEYTAGNGFFNFGYNHTTTQVNGFLTFPTPMRVAPTVSSSAASTFYYQSGGTLFTPSAISFTSPTQYNVTNTLTCSGLTLGYSGACLRQSGTCFIEASAEL